MLTKVYINLIDQKEPTLNFKNNNNDFEASKVLDISYYKKIVVPSKEEIEQHKKYLKKELKKNYFS